MFCIFVLVFTVWVEEICAYPQQYWCQRKSYTYATSNHLLTIILQVHNQTSRHLTRCQCSHLTWFGADLFIPPNKLDIKASIKKLAELHKHPALLATFCTVIGLYILGMIWARRKDRNDITKVWVKYLSCLQLSEPSQQWKRFLRARQAPTLRVATSSLPNLPLSINQR